MTTTPRLLRSRDTPKVESEELDWKSLTSYRAQMTFQEKISRGGNITLLGTALYGVYCYLTGPMGIVSYAGIALAVRKIASATIGYCVYPAAFTSLPGRDKRYIQAAGQEQIQILKNEGFFCKKISIYKSGTKYDAVLVGRASTIDNGKWTIHALGNEMTMETAIESLAKENAKNKSNALLMNGPSVCESGGWPTRHQLGAGFEAGIQFLEREIKATHIAMCGLSLGGGMMAEAILNHDFAKGQKENIRYLSISDRTFSRLSTIAANLVGSIILPIFYMTDTELDGIGAAKKLSRLNIRHIVIQHHSPNARGSDSVIPDSVSLAQGLYHEGNLPHKVFLKSTHISHNGQLPKDIATALNREVHDFFHTR